MNLERILDDLEKAVKDYALEIGDIYEERNDSSEEKGVRTGRLHENHILGIILKHYLEEQEDVTTTDIEEEYQIFYKKIARSTVSTYLNQLEKEGVLLKKRDGRTVKYMFAIPPTDRTHPFWIVRNFCLLPAYLSRAGILANIYLDQTKIHEKYERERKFMLGLTILTILKNRFQKCHLCQFGLKAFYNDNTERFETFIKDRIDVLPEEIRNFILFELGELPIFGGIVISPTKESINELYPKILDFVERYHGDIEFQISVSKHRQRVHLKRMNPENEDEN